MSLFAQNLLRVLIIYMAILAALLPVVMLYVFGRYYLRLTLKPQLIKHYITPAKIHRLSGVCANYLLVLITNFFVLLS